MSYVYLQPYDYNRHVLFWDASFASAFIHSFDLFLVLSCVVSASLRFGPWAHSPPDFVS